MGSRSPAGETIVLCCSKNCVILLFLELVKRNIISVRLLSSIQSLDRLGRRGGMMDDSAEILLQSFLPEALVSSSGIGRDT